MDTARETLSPEAAERLDALLAKLEPVGEETADTPLLQLRHIELTDNTLTVLVQATRGTQTKITLSIANSDIGSTGVDTHCGWTADGRSYALLEFTFADCDDMADSLTLTTEQAIIDGAVVDFPTSLTLDLTELKGRL